MIRGSPNYPAAARVRQSLGPIKSASTQCIHASTSCAIPVPIHLFNNAPSRNRPADALRRRPAHGLTHGLMEHLTPARERANAREAIDESTLFSTGGFARLGRLLGAVVVDPNAVAMSLY